MIPFRYVWFVDFEFQSVDGERQRTWCMSAREYYTGRTIRMWRDELLACKRAPFETGPDALVVAFYLTAELLSFLEFSWPFPVNMLDLFAEHRCFTNGRHPPASGKKKGEKSGRNGLLNVLVLHGLGHIDAAEKEAMRQLAIRGEPFTAEEKTALQDYNDTDTVALAVLMPRMAPSIEWEYALARGRYMAAEARMVFAGVPIDMETLHRLRDNWEAIKLTLIADVDKDFGVYEGTTFKEAKFQAYLDATGKGWQYFPDGGPRLDADTFDAMADRDPTFRTLQELVSTLGTLRLSKLAVGSDGRNRCMLSAFNTVTMRNSPSTSKFVYGPARWLRGLIKPPPSYGVACIDWVSQEFAIQGALSGDEAMMATYRAGDVYIGFGKSARLIPPDAEDGDPAYDSERDRCKPIVLGVGYGMGYQSMATWAGIPPCEARALLQVHHETYAQFWAWSASILDDALRTRRMVSVLGWRRHLMDDPKVRSSHELADPDCRGAHDAARRHRRHRGWHRSMRPYPRRLLDRGAAGPASPHFSPNQVHWGADSERIVLRPRFFSNPQDAPMQTDCTPALFEFPPVGGRDVVASFDGGAITSDAGALLLGQTDRAIRLTERFASCFADTRTAELVEHPVETMVMQRVVGIALGYEDLNDHDQLRRDPVLAVLAGKLEAQRSDCAPLAGKSTLNRLELSRAEPTRYHKVSHDPAAIESLFVDLFLEAHTKAPKQIILDLDATDDPLHGNQEGKFFHGYYDCYCYLPLYIFCGRHLLAAKLRRSNIDGAAGSVEEVARIVAQIRRRWPRTRILLRGDSGFTRETLMAWCEANRVDYVFGLARNDRLEKAIIPELITATIESIRTGRTARCFKDFSYTTLDSWSRERRVIGKAEVTGGEANPRFVVTSLKRSEAGARHLYEKTYCARGDMENRIKECQLDLFADRTSTATMQANQLRLWFASMAYVLLCALRRIGLAHSQFADATCGTIRLKLLKLGALVRVSVRRIKIAMASACPWQDEFALAHVRLRNAIG